MGVLASGQTALARLTLRNHGTEAVTVERVVTSCPCLRVSRLPAFIKAGAEHTLTVTFDPAAEPKFRGGLSIEMTGHDRDGEVVFKTEANLRVHDFSDASGVGVLPLVIRGKVRLVSRVAKSLDGDGGRS